MESKKRKAECDLTSDDWKDAAISATVSLATGQATVATGSTVQDRTRISNSEVSNEGIKVSTEKTTPFGSGGFLAYAKTNPFAAAIASNADKNPFTATGGLSSFGKPAPSISVTEPAATTHGDNVATGDSTSNGGTFITAAATKSLPEDGKADASTAANRTSAFNVRSNGPTGAAQSSTSSGFGANKVGPFSMPPPLVVPSPKSPKPNPFSSPSPAHNPFMTIASSTDELWKTMANDKLSADEAAKAERASSRSPKRAKFEGAFFGGTSTSQHQHSASAEGVGGSNSGSSGISSSSSRTSGIASTGGDDDGGNGSSAVDSSSTQTKNTQAADSIPPAENGADKDTTEAGSSSASHTEGSSSDSKNNVGVEDQDNNAGSSFVSSVIGNGKNAMPRDESLSAFKKAYRLDEKSKLTTGEESDLCLVQMRAKLYRLHVKSSSKPSTAAATTTATTSVPEGESLAVTATATVTQPLAASDGVSKSDTSRALAGGIADVNDAEWIEVGLGPLKVLESIPSTAAAATSTTTATAAGAGAGTVGINGDNAADSSIEVGDSTESSSSAEAKLNEASLTSGRLVMRREDKKGGIGIKLMLNSRLNSFTIVAKQGEKMIRLVCANFCDDIQQQQQQLQQQQPLQQQQQSASSIATQKFGTYLIKTKSSEEANELLQAIQRFI